MMRKVRNAYDDEHRLTQDGAGVLATFTNGQIKQEWKEEK
jgi:hypothetical protein